MTMRSKLSNLFGVLAVVPGSLVWVPDEQRIRTHAWHTTLAVWLRGLMRGLLLLVFCAVIIASVLSHIHIADGNTVGQMPASSGTTPSQALVLAICLASFWATVHATYAYVATKILILDPPLLKVRWQDIIIPITLTAAYGFYLAAAITRLPTLSVVTLIVFFAVYGLWLIRDVLDAFDATRRQRLVRWVWVGIDIVAFCGTAIAAHRVYITQDVKWCFGFSGTDYITAKDLIVLICLVFYVLFRLTSQRQRQADYVTYYNDYLEYVDEGEFLAKPSPLLCKVLREGLQDKLEMTGEGKWRVRDGTTLRIFDYGCANGRRLHELLWLLGLVAAPTAADLSDGEVELPAQVEIDGFDAYSDWVGHFKGRFQQSDRCNFHRRLPTGGRTWDLILVSHVLYDQGPPLSEVINFLRSPAACGLILVRGTSPYSIFQVLSRFGEGRFPRPTLGHLWHLALVRSLWKKCLVKDCLAKGHGFYARPPTATSWKERLAVLKQSFWERVGVRYHSMGIEDPGLSYLFGSQPKHVIIPQRYKLNEKSIPAFRNFVEAIYGTAIAELGEDICRELVVVADQQLVPNDDVAFVFRKTCPSGKTPEAIPAGIPVGVAK